MKLIVKTPLYQHNAYCPHLVEHCVLSWHKSVKKFFSHTLPLSEAQTKIGKTIFIGKDTKQIEEIQKNIKTTIDRSCITDENMKLQQELYSKKNEEDFLLEKIGKEIYKTQRIPSRKSKKLSHQIIIDYHTKRYNDKFIWVTNDKNKVIQRPVHLKKHKIKEYLKVHTKREKKITLSCYDKKYISFVQSYKYLEDYVELFFVDWLYDTYSLYVHRYEWKKYYYPTSFLFFYSNHLAFTRHESYILSIDFFEMAKKYFLNQEELINEIALDYEILSETIILSENIKNIITSIPLEKINYYFK